MNISDFVVPNYFNYLAPNIRCRHFTTLHTKESSSPPPPPPPPTPTLIAHICQLLIEEPFICGLKKGPTPKIYTALHCAVRQIRPFESFSVFYCPMQ